MRISHFVLRERQSNRFFPQKSLRRNHWISKKMVFDIFSRYQRSNSSFRVEIRIVSVGRLSYIRIGHIFVIIHRSWLFPSFSIITSPISPVWRRYSTPRSLRVFRIQKAGQPSTLRLFSYVIISVAKDEKIEIINLKKIMYYWIYMSHIYHKKILYFNFFYKIALCIWIWILGEKSEVSSPIDINLMKIFFWYFLLVFRSSLPITS